MALFISPKHFKAFNLSKPDIIELTSSQVMYFNLSPMEHLRIELSPPTQGAGVQPVHLCSKK